MIKSRKILLDTEALAVRFQVAPGTVRYWASMDGWTAYGTRRRRLWSLAVAQASYDKRHPEDDTLD